ncbi:hypothetical protein ACFPU1_06235 [Thalassorhabdus alkalitolerans]|uniref:Succinylglutamate desuccinylase / Aspartoacylase family protein n=1 Tax=Thalassorhabdus alkalitolerans TaxID=2282697 RepID=A0ABW0YMK7_9BACI
MKSLYVVLFIALHLLLIPEQAHASTAQDQDITLEDILTLEEPFADNDYNGNVDHSLPFEYRPGSTPILITAPHSVVHLREGEEKAAEIYTGALGFLLHEKTDVHYLYSTKRAEDANYAEGGLFKEAMTRIISQYDIQLVIDLHGAGRDHDFDIDLGTVYGKSLHSGRVEEFMNLFSRHGITDVRENDTFPAENPDTITHFSWAQLATPAVQVEINQKYRDPRDNIGAFLQVYNGLADIINSHSVAAALLSNQSGSIPFCGGHRVETALWKAAPKEGFLSPPPPICRRLL